MTKTTRNTASAAEDAFHKHCAAIWGQSRWHDSLYPALAQSTRYAASVNQYAPEEDFWQTAGEAGITRESVRVLSFPLQVAAPVASFGRTTLCVARDDGEMASNGDSGPPQSSLPFPPPGPAAGHPSKLLTHWNLDAASALAAHLLDIKPGDSVLDLCAAPGGKSVALAQKIWPAWHADSPATHRDAPKSAAGQLTSNEADRRRQKRLAENLQAYLPPQLIRQGRVQCTSVDATTSSVKSLTAKGGYDKVLVDAPCSSERHIIHAHIKARASGNSAPEMTNWRPGSSKRLAATQLALLLAALKAVRIGGTVMYATCSIEPTENDGVVEKMLQQVQKDIKKGAKWTVEFDQNTGLGEQMEQWAERTKHGWIVLPDHASGGKWGPLFFAKITKVAVG